MTGVPLDRIDLSPPIGYGKGLPLTLPFHLSGSWSTSGGTNDYIDADGDLWVRGENVNMAKAYGATWITGSPVYDSVRGWIWSSQVIAGQAPAPGSADSDNSWFGYSIGTGVTYSQPGRTRGARTTAVIDRTNVTADPILFSNASIGDSKGSPGNHTHQIGPIEQISSAMLVDNDAVVTGRGGYGRMYDRHTNNLIPPTHDVVIGTKLSVHAKSEAACVTFHTQVALPSGGNGRQWGDSHDTIYNVTLGASAFGIHTHEDHNGATFSTGLHSTRFNTTRNFVEPVHWVINTNTQGHYPYARVPISQTVQGGGTGDNPSSPPGLADVEIVASSGAGSSNNLEYYKSDLANWLQPTETSQAFVIQEPIASTTTLRELGPAYLGNHAVMDATGLIGFEGVFTASAFFSISEDETQDSSQGSGPWTYANGMHFAGLNIQVTSATPVRRASEIWLPGGMRGTRYGSDGALVRPMSDSMRTTGTMRGYDNAIPSPGLDTNQSTFFTGRTGLDRATALGDTATKTIDSVIHSKGVVPNQYIVGDTDALSDAFTGSGTNTTIGSTTMVGTEKVGARWMQDYIPTRVRVIPSVVGYETVNVAPGSSKTTAYEDDDVPNTVSTIAFKKPIVDYHVLVSLCKKTGSIEGATSTSLSTRNDPAFDNLSLNVDLSSSPAVIMHSIFRINPTTLEQVYMGNTVCDWGGSRNTAEYSKLNGFDQVMPRHTYSDSVPSRQGWGLHQVTPFRPIRSQSFDKIPKFLGTIEPGGMYQRGGISHLWDADVYGGELLVAANLNDSTALGGGTPTTDSRTGKNWFGPIWRFGQTWDTTTPEIPPGEELMIFRYSPQQDPYYPSGTTTITDNPIYTRFNAAGRLQYLQGAFDSDLHNDRVSGAVNGLTWASTVDARREGSDGNSWALHDWVFPRVELMKYLGTEDKANTDNHPTISCGALRVMEDGRMMMAAVHRDKITANTQYPDATIGYPINPDNAFPRCPPGYYYDGTTCQPIIGSLSSSSLGGHLNPDAEIDTDDATPTPEVPPTASAGSLSNSTVFGEWPTFSKLIANSSARSLILLWTDTPADKGKVKQGRCDFSGTWNSNNAGGWTWKQTLNLQDTWWSGARTSYWYPESGQRAIPCVYGAYPEMRLSNVTLPRSVAGISPTDAIIEGYPTIQHIGRQSMVTAGHLYGGHTGSGTSYATASDSQVWGKHFDVLNTQWSVQQNWLKRQHWVPTTYGFTDFVSGCKPWYHKSYSSWSLPLDLIDPAWDTTQTHFAHEGANAEQQILSGFSSSMGLLPGKDYNPGAGEFSGDTDDHQGMWLSWDFGQFMRYPKGASATNRGQITHYMGSSGYTSITAVGVDDLDDIKTWINGGTGSPFTSTDVYGDAVVEGSRIIIPVTLQTDVLIGQNTGIRINMNGAASGTGETLVFEPQWIMPRNLIDLASYTT